MKPSNFMIVDPMPNFANGKYGIEFSTKISIAKKCNAPLEKHKMIALLKYNNNVPSEIL